MKIPKTSKIEKCVGNEVARPILHKIFVGKLTGRDEGTFAIATDGRQLVCVPVEMEPGDEENLLLTPEQVANLRKQKNGVEVSKGCLRFGVNGEIDPDPVETDHNRTLYPKIEKVLPEPKKLSFVVSLDAELLVKMQRAMGAEGVKLVFEDELSPITVKPQGDEHIRGSFGVLMPMRMT